jgi:hypothetical protein
MKINASLLKTRRIFPCLAAMQKIVDANTFIIPIVATKSGASYLVRQEIGDRKASDDAAIGGVLRHNKMHSGASLRKCADQKI